MTHVTCRLTAKNRDQLRNPRSAVEYGLPFPPWSPKLEGTRPTGPIRRLRPNCFRQMQPTDRLGDYSRRIPVRKLKRTAPHSTHLSCVLRQLAALPVGRGVATWPAVAGRWLAANYVTQSGAMLMTSHGVIDEINRIRFRPTAAHFLRYARSGTWA